MTRVSKGAASVPLDDVSEQAVESLLSSADWQKRLAEARVQREKVLAERAKQNEFKKTLTAPKKPWERDMAPRATQAVRQAADPVDVAAARASLLLPQVMRATRADATAEAKPVVADVVQRLRSPQVAPETSAALPAVVPHLASVPDAVGASGAVTILPVAPALVFSTTRPAALAVAVAPLVAPERNKTRPLLLAVGAAFAAGLGLGGGVFLWLDAFSGPEASVVAPQVSVLTASTDLPGRAVVETSPAASIQTRIDRPEIAKLAAALAVPSGPDNATVVLPAPAITSVDPVTTAEFGIGEMSDVVLPQSDTGMQGILRPDVFVLAGVAEDAPPTGIAPPVRPTDLGWAVLAGLNVPVTGEVLGYAPATGLPAPSRLVMPGLSNPGLEFGAGKAVADAAFTDPGALASSAPPPAPRVLAGAAFADVTVRLLVSPRAAASAAGQAETVLRDSGFVLSDSKPITHKINQTHVRYYFAQDQAAADAVAVALGTGARMFAPPARSTASGNVEVWIGGPAPGQDAGTVADTSVTSGAKVPAKAVKVAAKVKKKSVSSAAARRKAEQQQLRALRDQIIIQLQNGVQP